MIVKCPKCNKILPKNNLILEDIWYNKKEKVALIPETLICTQCYHCIECNYNFKIKTTYMRVKV